jgi:hypothetical protein
MRRSRTRTGPATTRCACCATSTDLEVGQTSTHSVVRLAPRLARRASRARRALAGSSRWRPAGGESLTCGECLSPSFGGGVSPSSRRRRRASSVAEPWRRGMRVCGARRAQGPCARPAGCGSSQHHGDQRRATGRHAIAAGRGRGRRNDRQERLAPPNAGAKPAGPTHHDPCFSVADETHFSEVVLKTGTSALARLLVVGQRSTQESGPMINSPSTVDTSAATTAAIAESKSCGHAEHIGFCPSCQRVQLARWAREVNKATAARHARLTEERERNARQH